ncbi:MAG: trigger factor [candidate division Zixibacteria bacterium RBG_16_53_22]|nr:MAG: trigger factor [candidate division Zixibacteria bacterium RBG_16_53_22]
MSPTDESDNIDNTSDTETADADLEGMKVNLRDGQAWARFLEIELPAENVNSLFASTFEDYRRKAKVPGFRPGKTPAGIIRQRYGSDIRQDVFETLVPRAYEKALIQMNLVPLNPPKLSDVQFEEGRPLKFKAEFEVRPVVTLNKYTGFRVEKSIPQIGEKEVDDSLNYLRERLAEYHPVQRPTENGDMVIVDMFKKHDKFGRLKEDKLENVEINLGSKGLLEEFQRGIPGMRIGEMKDISVKYPPDYYDTNLAGDQILYMVIVKEIKKKVLPELNDEFATKVSRSQNLAELRDKMRESLKRQAQEDATKQMRNEIIKRIIDSNPLDAPISLLDNYLDGIVEDYKQRGAAVDEPAIRSEYRSLGENLIRWGYLYYEIARKENIKIDADDRKKWVENFARTYNMTEEEARERLGRARKLEDIDDSILESKVLQFIIDKSEILTSQ